MSELALFSLLLVALGAEGCPACLARQELRQLSLTHIKERILVKLGLTHPPNITGRPLPRIPLLDQFYEKMQADQAAIEDDPDDTIATLEKAITFAQPHPKMRHWRGKEFLYFKFTDKMLENKVVKAMLWIFVGTNQNDSEPHINVFKISSTEPTFLEATKAIVKEVMPREGQGRWIKVDVTPLVSEWFKIPNENKGLAIQATISGPGSLISSQRFIRTIQSDAAAYVPFIEVHITPLAKHRPKRAIGLNCPENSEETRCCRYPLTVDFEEFGWDWIIAPKKYEANYCSGECPYVWLPQYTHTHIVQQASPSGTSGPCCAPRKMSSISMLYFDQEFNIIYGLLPGMVVDRCGCS